MSEADCAGRPEFEALERIDGLLDDLICLAMTDEILEDDEGSAKYMS